MELVAIACVVVLGRMLGIANSATIGDGTRSIYSGRLVNDTTSNGNCYVDGRRYFSETAVPREHPCHYCICHESKVTCYWKHCGPAPINCVVLHFENTCNPSLYMCKIPEKALNAPRRRKTPPPFGTRLKRFRLSKRSLKGYEGLTLDIPFMESFKFDADFVKRLERSLSPRRKRNTQQQDRSCSILGVKYNLGEIIGVASTVCMECRCAAGKMYCSPKCCFHPSPFTLGARDEALMARSSLEKEPPHPLSYVRNQYEEATVL